MPLSTLLPFYSRTRCDDCFRSPNRPLKLFSSDEPKQWEDDGEWNVFRVEKLSFPAQLQPFSDTLLQFDSNRSSGVGVKGRIRGREIFLNFGLPVLSPWRSIKLQYNDYLLSSCAAASSQGGGKVEMENSLQKSTIRSAVWCALFEGKKQTRHASATGVLAWQ